MTFLHDSGQILLTQKVEIKNPFDAKNLASIWFFNTLVYLNVSVYENLILGIDENLSFKN